MLLKLLLMKKHSLVQPVYQYIVYTYRYSSADDSKDQLGKIDSELESGHLHQTVNPLEKQRDFDSLHIEAPGASGVGQPPLDSGVSQGRPVNKLQPKTRCYIPGKASKISSIINPNISRGLPQNSDGPQSWGTTPPQAPAPVCAQGLLGDQIVRSPARYPGVLDTLNTGNLQSLLQRGAILEPSQSAPERFSLPKNPSTPAARPRIFVMNPIYSEKIKLNIAMAALKKKPNYRK